MILNHKKGKKHLTHFKKQVKIKQIATILACLLCCCSLKNHAQRYNEEYHLPVAGLLGGINMTQVDGDGYKGYNQVGFTGGGIIYLPFGEMDMPIDGTVALSMEVLFSQKGSKGGAPIPGAGIESQTIKLQYAEVPFQINFYQGSRKSNFGMGLSVGYLASSEELIYDNSGVRIKEGLPPFRKFEFSFVFSGNVHLWKGIFLGPRFQYSLLSVRKNNGMFGGRIDQFNNVVSLRLMYLFKRADY